jgi:hypothetical protein
MMTLAGHQHAMCACPLRLSDFVRLLLAAAGIKDYNFNSPPSRYHPNTAHFTQVGGVQHTMVFGVDAFVAVITSHSRKITGPLVAA